MNATVINPNLVSYLQLCEYLGVDALTESGNFSSAAKKKAIKWLSDTRVDYSFDCNGNPITTLSQLNNNEAAKNEEVVTF